ncbi:MAG: DUF309 domain-containing protein [Planctomycetes bacterium]|jgi:predicted metal-dependent hydrolase|nr:DUF309 domain-containing protein [Planctomycetota bacterium]MCL4731019.1 DUF309 domain-containing protein [Planctomycetota bacterium]
MTDPGLKSATDAWLWQSALAAFAARDWFEVHELLEELWRRAPEPEKTPLQGLLQAAVCLYHWGNGNFAGARILAAEAADKLARSPAHWRGLDLAGYLQRFRAAVAPLHQPGARLKPLRPQDAPLP